jgi:hypothetical protein
MGDGVIRWEDPPRSHQSNGRPKQPRRHEHWKKVAEQLRERPGEWAVLLEAERRFGNGGGIAGQIKAGLIAPFRPARTFEATTRTVLGLYIVYARYIGEAGSVATPNDLPGPTGEVRSA